MPKCWCMCELCAASDRGGWGGVAGWQGGWWRRMWEDCTLTRCAEERQVHVQEERRRPGIRARERRQREAACSSDE